MSPTKSPARAVLAKGVALLDVVVALAVVAVSAFFIAQVVGAAVRYSGAAEATQRALDEAEATLANDASAGPAAGWQVIPGCSTCPAASEPPAPCYRRGARQGNWLWVEVVCNPAADPTVTGTEPRGAGVAPRVTIAVLR